MSVFWYRNKKRHPQPMENKKWSSHYYRIQLCRCLFPPPGALPNARFDFNLASPSISLSLFFSLFPSIFLSGHPLPHILLRFPIRPERHLFLSLTLFREVSFDCSSRFLSLPIFDIHTARDRFAVMYAIPTLQIPFSPMDLAFQSPRNVRWETMETNCFLSAD